MSIANLTAQRPNVEGYEQFGARGRSYLRAAEESHQAIDTHTQHEDPGEIRRIFGSVRSEADRIELSERARELMRE